MKTIVINSQKGGSGKTTLVAHLAVEAERAGDGPVYLIDTDPQGTLSTWHEHREAETPQRVEVPLADLATGLLVGVDDAACRRSIFLTEHRCASAGLSFKFHVPSSESRSEGAEPALFNSEFGT